MTSLPTLHTERLLLRPFRDDDAPAVAKLAGDRRVADTTLAIPHPYGDGVAEAWIATHEASWELGRGLVLAVCLRGRDTLLGAAGLTIAPEHRAAELGYWIGVPFWKNGYATEAARALVDFGFAKLELNRIHACHFARNTASGRVLEKVGMTLEGLQREAVIKWDRKEDVRLLAILRAGWAARRKA